MENKKSQWRHLIKRILINRMKGSKKSRPKIASPMKLTLIFLIVLKILKIGSKIIWTSSLGYLICYRVISIAILTWRMETLMIILMITIIITLMITAVLLNNSVRRILMTRDSFLEIKWNIKRGSMIIRSGRNIAIKWAKRQIIRG